MEGNYRFQHTPPEMHLWEGGRAMMRIEKHYMEIQKAEAAYHWLTCSDCGHKTRVFLFPGERTEKCSKCPLGWMERSQ